jgi:ectoine hydroxylase-related dioxygenase (phytanoyl-CoA dioxygenase family)
MSSRGRTEFRTLVPSTLAETLAVEGYAFLDSGLEPSHLSALRMGIFAAEGPGTRCLLDDPLVREAAKQVALNLRTAGVLSPAAVAVQAIAFDKTAGMNWKVTWHQDVMFPFARAASGPDFTLACVKDGVDFARPPIPILESLLAARIHLDECNADSGPLRVLPRSHQRGVIPSAELANEVGARTAVSCLAADGEALLMKPLLVHASSRAERPQHRRVLHLVYYDGPPLAEVWHRAY